MYFMQPQEQYCGETKKRFGQDTSKIQKQNHLVLCAIIRMHYLSLLTSHRMMPPLNKFKLFIQSTFDLIASNNQKNTNKRLQKLERWYNEQEITFSSSPIRPPCVYIKCRSKVNTSIYVYAVDYSSDNLSNRR